MSGVTDADRERAAMIVGSMADVVLGRLLKRDIAAALAAEREKARAPFLALVTEYAGEALSEHFGGHTTAGEILRDIRSIAEADA